MVVFFFFSLLKENGLLGCKGKEWFALFFIRLLLLRYLFSLQGGLDLSTPCVRTVQLCTHMRISLETQFVCLQVLV